MPNPYFPSSFNPGDYGLTVFQPDMVLTADQLNLMFGYLLYQEQRTRTRLIGVGVVCGLQPQIQGTGITVSAGCGVTTEGDLISFETSRTFTEFAPYALADHPDYSPFLTIAGLQLWELFPGDYPNQLAKQPLSSLSLTDKVVLLYLESTVKSADACTGVACDNKGDAFNNRLHVLLARKTDAAALITAGHRAAAGACSRLPVLTMPRVRLDSLDYAASLTRFQGFIRRTANLLAAGLQNAYNVLQPLSGVTPVADWVRVLREKAEQNSKGANIQYVYDWLKDLHDAFAEFREAACGWLVQCLPPETAFPKHLLLGELVQAPGTCQPEYRHAFLRSPAVAAEAEARQKALWLFQRLGRLIEQFEIPQTLSDTFSIVGRSQVSVLHSLRITPDHYRSKPLRKRSLPFYYQPGTRAFWSYDLSRRCRTTHIRSFHIPAGAPPEVEKPFGYQIEAYPFYRIEGFLGAGLHAVLERVLALRQEHNLAFEVVALRADASQPLITEGASFDYEDLAIDFEDLSEQIRCLERETRAQTANALAVNLKMNKVLFASTIAAYRKRLNPKVPQEACISAKLPLLERLNLRYHSRKEQVESRLTFGPFLREHPGMEHGAGVPRGGTFILVYKSVAQKGNFNSKRGAGGMPVVVADFYLPYRCCPGGDAVQLVLPEPPPSVEMEKTRFCLKDRPEKITVSPSGGTFAGNLVSRQGDTFYFTPDTVGSHTLTYTAPNGKTASLGVEVLHRPTAAFRFGQQQGGNEGFVSFSNLSTHATQVTWDFGDGSDPQTISLSSGNDGGIQHPYKLKEDGSGSFTVKLAASNGVCQDETEQKLEFRSRPEIFLRAEEIVCFHREQRQKVEADPKGGDFSSDTLRITKKGGEYPPNQPGTHTITYTLDDQSASINVFVVPNSLGIENIEQDGNNFRVAIIAPTPPENLTYGWLLNEEPTEPTSEKKDGNGNSRFTFVLSPADLRRNPSLTLIFRQGDKELCERVKASVSR